jgi:ribulose-5-phosphate 4-epimerase/fuculose-1-phosphate aldolase
MASSNFHHRVVAADSQSTSPAEREVRRDLAAMYRLAALNGWDDLIFTHISAEVPGSPGQFLINPLGLMFDEINASSLVKVDSEGHIIDGDGAYTINRAGFVIHSAIHSARKDARFVIHLHTLDGMAVSCQSEGLLPLAQTSLTVIPQLAYLDYEGIALDTDERERLVAAIGQKTLLMLRNHGTLAIGRSAGEAWLSIYALDRACTLQIRALSAGPGAVLLAPEDARQKVAQQVENMRSSNELSAMHDLVWNALLRRVERLSPGFDA